MSKLNAFRGVLQRGARWVLSEELDTLKSRVGRLEAAAERDRSRSELGIDLARSFIEARRTDGYRAAFTEADPLVTVIVATYNRAHLLLERSVGSLLAQTHQNLQIVVVGDHCTDDTMNVLASIDDPRIEAVNLPERGPYPENGFHRWMVAGSPAMNEGLRRARGTFVTHLDDDDWHPPHRVETLLKHIQASEADVLWHPFRHQQEDGSWLQRPCEEFVGGSVTTSSIFYHSWLARIHWDPFAYLSLEPGDWNRLRKFVWLDTKRERVDEYLLDHYREWNNA